MNSPKHVEHISDESLDTLFQSADSVIAGNFGSDHTDTEFVDHGNNDYLEEDEGASVPTKSIFKKWYFWVGCIVVFMGIVGALFVSQKMSLPHGGNADYVPEQKMAPVPVAAPVEPKSIAPAVTQPTTGPTAVTTEAVVTAAPSAAIAPAPLMMPEVVTDIGKGAGKPKIVEDEKKDENNARITALEAEVKSIQVELDHVKKNAGSAPHVEHQKTVAAKAKITATKSKTAKSKGEKEEIISEKASENRTFAGGYHVKGISPGQAFISNGKTNKYLSIGTEIDGATVIKIDSDLGLVFTSAGVIR